MNLQQDPIPNKIANSGLITISPEDYYPRGERKHIDISQWLDQGLILREKAFREAIKNHDWEQYRDCYVWIDCSTEAIIPQWSYMLLGAKLSEISRGFTFGSRQQLESMLIEEVIRNTDLSEFRDKKVIIKGCGDQDMPPQAYLSLTSALKPIVKSLMYGEACSTVPVFKNKS